jgi:hypothetical protein
MNFFLSKTGYATTPINQPLIVDVGETRTALIMLSPTMVWRSLDVFVGTTFGELNITPRSQTLVAWCCKKTLNTTAKPKSFQNKQIMVFLFYVMLVISLQLKVYQLSYISFGFVMVTLCVVW